MKKTYQKPEAEIIELEIEDVITVSGEQEIVTGAPGWD